MNRKLHLIPVPIGSNLISYSIPIETLKLSSILKTYIAENARTARSFLKQIHSKYPLNEITIYTITNKTQDSEIEKWLSLENIGDIGLVSEAGCPAIADPGSQVVRVAHNMGIQIKPYVGPSSIILGLMSSGLNGQNFAFRGYAPKKQEERIKTIAHWEKESLTNNQTQILIETPYRNTHLYDSLINTLNQNTKLCVASSLNSMDEEIKTLNIKQWKAQEYPNIHKKPTIFLYMADNFFKKS
ncbi:SAM-dependent methyltransferase [Candidatus Kinetoplastidibacterium crithidiae]|uniref:Putative methyltransferase n=1 Tax=Candidatus Kinetoplastidibacterium crithidiae TCC036E TaxID=1208918 RepID=M1LUI6_9PROT|nr:SAM-dependent methyltransferase [Candidatus Kinetoplastibacterium crithidii]AFZ82587.1 16S rRNA (cytidine1402-2'-O)-methyltransferase [Candidatus Kinetoplastibacterium crithidii (ex Angomonas deanei ATCC 30255)]AGF47751.1 putative methyltransferase [Candidatus Kinetoplastibacterium crithidii TCC036E]